MDTKWLRALAVAGAALLPGTCVAGQSVDARIDAASPAPDGRHVLVRLELRFWETEPVRTRAEAFLADPAARTLRPLVHAPVRAWRGPAGTLLFATRFGLFEAPAGRPSVGRPVLPLPWSHLEDRDGFVTALRFVDERTVRVLRTSDAGNAHDAWELTLDGSSAPRRFAEHVDESSLGGPADPEWTDDGSLRLLRRALLLGWTADGRAILRDPEGGPCWLVDPDAGDGVELAGDHPGAVREPSVRLIERTASCPGDRSVTELWLDDVRDPAPPVLAVPFVSNWGFMGLRRDEDGTLRCR
jgi:hypothetical protein